MSRPRAALYLRVSSEKQTASNQRKAVEQLARARGFEPVVFEEVESARKVRPVLELVLAQARAGELAAVVVWSLDRLHRSMTATVATVLELDRLGVPVISCREQWLDTAGPTRALLVAIFGWVAEQELAQLRERTRAGVARARAQGKRIGRPRVSPIMLSVAADMVNEKGYPVTLAARTAGVKETTLRRFLAERKGGVPGAGARGDRRS